MSIRRYATARDENEPEIVKALEAYGYGVHRIHDTGFPDLVVGLGNQHWLIEVIGDAKAKRFRRLGGLTLAQTAFHSQWPGKIYKVRSVEDALAAVNEN